MVPGFDLTFLVFEARFFDAPAVDDELARLLYREPWGLLLDEPTVDLLFQFFLLPAP